MGLDSLDEFLKKFYTDRGKDKTLIDLHLHTNYSDGFISGKSLLHYLEDKNYCSLCWGSLICLLGKSGIYYGTFRNGSGSL